MKKITNVKETTAPRRLRWLKWTGAIIAVLIVITIAFWGSINFVLQRSFAHNYAEDVGRPIIDELTTNGAIKRCESGDPGKGPDQYEPLYSALLELPANRDQALKLLNAAAEKNGFKLEHARTGGPLPVPDTYIDDYYFDHSYKTVDFPGINSGSARLTVRLLNKPYVIAGSSCNNSKSDVTINAAADRTAITVDVALPRSK